MDVKSNSTVLVTGSSGFVGGNLIRALLEDGRTVRSLKFSTDRGQSELNVDTRAGDVLDCDSLVRAMQGVDIVYHLAAVISFTGKRQRHRMFRVNVDGTANVVRACQLAGVEKLIHFSSIHALSHLPLDEAIDEDRPLALGPPHLDYDQSKARSELAVLEGVESGLDAVIINPTWIFGPQDYRPSASGEFLLQLIRGQLPALVSAGYFCVDVRDVVAAAIQAESNGKPGHRYILAGEHVTFRDLANWSCEAAGVDIRPPRLTLPLGLAAAVAPFVHLGCRCIGRPPLMTSDSIKILKGHQHIATSRAAQDLNWNPRPMRQTVGDTIDWLRQHNALS